ASIVPDYIQLAVRAHRRVGKQVGTRSVVDDDRRRESDAAIVGADHRDALADTGDVLGIGNVDGLRVRTGARPPRGQLPFVQAAYWAPGRRAEVEIDRPKLGEARPTVGAPPDYE